MKASGFTSRQRRIVLLLVLIVVGVFALLAGFLITSLKGLEPAPPSTASPVPPRPSPSPTPPPAPATSTPEPREGIWGDVRAARLFDQIAHQLEMERALAPRAEVPLSFLGQDEMEEMLLRRYTEDDVSPGTFALEALGLLPGAPRDVQVHAPAGVYVPEQQQLYVSTERREDDPDELALLAHAYLHALQDQHFDLEALNARARTTDQRLAVQALIEGDATLATALYVDEDLAAVDWQRLTGLIVRAERPECGGDLAGCAAWARLQRFANHEGRIFASAVYDHGGWDALNRSYTNLPRSTEQILHPERYLGLSTPSGEPAQPDTVVVPDLGPALDEAWQLRLRDTLGEFAIGLYLDQLSTGSARRIADGWDGDTFVLWQRDDGQRILVWRTVWESSEDAADYAQAMTSLITQLHVPARPIGNPRGLPGRWWETDVGTLNVRRTARYVTLLRAPDTNSAINVARILP